MANQVTTEVTGFAALSAPQQMEHRAKIGVRAQAILGQFWNDASTPEAVQSLEIEGWMDVLENCSHSEVRQAWATYQKTGPRSQAGRLSKPDAGALYRIILNARPKPKLVQPEPEAKDPPCSPEAAAEILAAAGYAPKRFGGAS